MKDTQIRLTGGGKDVVDTSRGSVSSSTVHLVDEELATLSSEASELIHTIRIEVDACHTARQALGSKVARVASGLATKLKEVKGSTSVQVLRLTVTLVEQLNFAQRVGVALSQLADVSCDLTLLCARDGCSTTYSSAVDQW